MVGDERVVGEIGMLADDAIDLGRLTGAQALVRIETPDAFEQALPAQNLVASGDAAMKIMCDIEEGGIAISHARIEREKILADVPGSFCRAAAFE